MKKNKKKFLVIIGVIFLMFLSGCFFVKYNNNKRIEKDNSIKLEREKLVGEISNHYGEFVKTSDTISLFNKEEIEVGKLGSGVELVLEEQVIDYETEYFMTKIDDYIYYVKYQDVSRIEKLSDISKRYDNYIVFNENIITKERTSFYDEDGNLIYQFDRSFEFVIIIKDDDKYGVLFEDRLLYVKSEDVSKVVESSNTNLSNTRGIPVLNYHFVYENGNTKFNEEICHSEAQMTEHFSYIKDNGFFTPTMRELEMYIDGKIRLPKSVVITFDDGALAENARNYVDKFKLNGTLFLITSWFDKEQFESEYLEVHSHGHDLHNPGVCSGGQGGAIKCLEEE